MIIKKKNDDFEQHPPTEEPIRAVVVDVTSPKKKDTAYGPKEKFAIVFETEMKMEDGKPWTFWSHGYTPSVGEKSNLAKDAKKILGVTVIGEEFDTETLIGKPVKLMIEHRRDGEKVYANLSYLKAYEGSDPLKPSGTFVREKDRPAKEEGGSSYTKVPADSAPAAPAWHETKIHVGQFAGHVIADIPEPALEKVEALLAHWWPTVEAKPSADDKRLHAALVAAQKALSQPAAPAAAAKF